VVVVVGGAWVVVVVGGREVVVVGVVVVVVGGRVVVVVGDVVVVVKIGIVVVVEKNGSVVVVVGVGIVVVVVVGVGFKPNGSVVVVVVVVVVIGLGFRVGRRPPRNFSATFAAVSVPVQGMLVDLVELNAPPRNSDPEFDLDDDDVEEGSDAEMAAETAEAIGVDDAARDDSMPRSNCTVPGSLGFWAADASIATTPSRTEDATRSVRSWPMRLDGVTLGDLKLDNLPMRQI
jgi:hypothetical protein